MKIIFINTVANSGSTGRIATSLYNSLDPVDEGCVVYGRGSCDRKMQSYKVSNTADFIFHVLRNFLKGEGGFGSTEATKRLVDYLKRESPDLIHLHNIHGFYLNCEILFDYLKEVDIPVVWTLHDCWPFTGHCAYFDYVKCEKWKTGCSSCPQYRTAYPYSLFCDNSYPSYNKKKAVFQGVKNLTIVTPSSWLESLVRESFLRNYSIEVIRNGIDLNIFNCKIESKRKKKTKPYLVLAVANIWEKRKGLKCLIQLASLLDDDYQIMIVGLNFLQRCQIKMKYRGKKIVPKGRTKGIEELQSLYNTASVYVNTTLEDNFPTTNLEALACGTPVITFETGGSPECVDEECGVVVEKGNIEDLRRAVQTVCTTGVFETEQCLKRAEDFDYMGMTEKYKELYRRVVKLN